MPSKAPVKFINPAKTTFVTVANKLDFVAPWIFALKATINRTRAQRPRHDVVLAALQAAPLAGRNAQCSGENADEVIGVDKSAQSGNLSQGQL